MSNIYFVLGEFHEIKNNAPNDAHFICGLLHILIYSVKEKTLQTLCFQGFIRFDVESGDPAGIRTQDHYIKSVMLYQLSYGIICYSLVSGVQKYNFYSNILLHNCCILKIKSIYFLIC